MADEQHPAESEDPIVDISPHERRIVNHEIREFNRRQTDIFFDRWVKPVIGWAIIALIIAGGKTWLDVTMMENRLAQIQAEVQQRATIDGLILRDERIRQLDAKLELILRGCGKNTK